MDELKYLDRETLMSRMAAGLPEIRNSLGMDAETVADKLKMGRSEYLEIEGNKRKLKWSEYMSLLFLFWSDTSGRAVIESKGLFPDALKKAMSVNRNEHKPMKRSNRE